MSGLSGFLQGYSALIIGVVSLLLIEQPWDGRSLPYLLVSELDLDTSADLSFAVFQICFHSDFLKKAENRFEHFLKESPETIKMST